MCKMADAAARKKWGIIGWCVRLCLWGSVDTVRRGGGWRRLDARAWFWAWVCGGLLRELSFLGFEKAVAFLVKFSEECSRGALFGFVSLDFGADGVEAAFEVFELQAALESLGASGGDEPAQQGVVVGVDGFKVDAFGVVVDHEGGGAGFAFAHGEHKRGKFCYWIGDVGVDAVVDEPLDKLEVFAQECGMDGGFAGRAWGCEILEVWHGSLEVFCGAGLGKLDGDGEVEVGVLGDDLFDVLELGGIGQQVRNHVEHEKEHVGGFCSDEEAFGNLNEDVSKFCVGLVVHIVLGFLLVADVLGRR